MQVQVQVQVQVEVVVKKVSSKRQKLPLQRPQLPSQKRRSAHSAEAWEAEVAEVEGYSEGWKRRSMRYHDMMREILYF